MGLETVENPAAAVDQEPVSSVLDEDAGLIALAGGHRAAGSEKRDAHTQAEVAEWFRSGDGRSTRWRSEL
ncbi:hypothetical protein GCM10028857_08040 [Salinarchaeum chitinilyticum]